MAVLYPSRGLFAASADGIPPQARGCDLPRLQPLAGRVLQPRAEPLVRRGDGLAARRRGRGARGGLRRRGARHEGDLHPTEPGEREDHRPPRLRRVLRRGRAPERADRDARGRRRAPRSIRAQALRHALQGPHDLSRGREHGRLHGSDRRRRARATPEAARGLPRGLLRLGALVARTHGRALRGLPRLARGHPSDAQAERVLRAPVLRLGRGRRARRAVRGRRLRAAQPRDGERLSARRRQLSARDRQVPRDRHALGRRQAQGALGQPGAPLRAREGIRGAGAPVSRRGASVPPCASA